MSETEDQLRFLTDNRAHARGKVTRTVNSINYQLSELDRTSCLDSIAKLKSLQDKLTKQNDEISKLLWSVEKDRTKLNRELEKIDEYDETILLCINALQRRVETLGAALASSSQNVSDTTGGSVLRSNRLKLPELPLPHYYRKPGESLERFFTNFENVVEKYSLSEYERFILLSKQVHNDALTLINSLQGCRQSYTEAKNILEKAFASPILQKFEIINNLRSLNLSKAGDCYKFISEMSMIIDSFENLKITTDDVLTCFIWSAMPDALKLQLTHITNSSRPTLEQIREYIFEAVNRYKNENSVQKPHATHYSKESTVAHAVNVNVGKKFKPCVLCSDNNNKADHPIYRCSRYDNPKAKLDRLDYLKFFTKCGFDNHHAKNCTFRFNNPCNSCKCQHFNFLCSPQFKGKQSVSNTTATLDAGEAKKFGNVAILPTFTGILPSNASLRALRDSGAQANFILKDLAERENLNILKHVSLDVTGFNSCREYDTTVVEVPLTLGQKTHVIEAICVPSISTNLNLPGLGHIVQDIKKKGYLLADKSLNSDSDCIQNI